MTSFLACSDTYYKLSRMHCAARNKSLEILVCSMKKANLHPANCGILASSTVAAAADDEDLWD